MDSNKREAILVAFLKIQNTETKTKSGLKDGYLLGQVSGPSAGSSFCAALLAAECSEPTVSNQEVKPQGVSQLRGNRL